MAARTVEIFSAGCFACGEMIERIEEVACPSCGAQVRDSTTDEGERRARAPGVRAVPAVAIDGGLVGCCEDAGRDMEAPKDAGLGRPA